MFMKRIVLVAVVLFCFSIVINAQTETQISILKKFALEHAIKEKNEYDKAVALAKEKGWPIVFSGKNGSVMALQYIDERGNPIYYTSFSNTIAAATTRANQLWPGGSSGLNLSGSSNAVKGKMGIWDGGAALTTHVELTGRIVVRDASSTTDHATHTSGTLIASGVNPIAKGMAYGQQQLISYDYVNDETSEIISEAPNLVLSNHSYGIAGGWNYTGTSWIWQGDTTISTAKSYLCGRYGNPSLLYDSIAYNAPNYLMVFAAGNSNGTDATGKGPALGASYRYNGGATVGRTANIPNNPTYGSVSGGQTAKNILVVGAVSGLPNGYVSSNDVQIGSFSCWGPTNDGRIKPDIVADGVGVTSSVATSTTSYASYDGTSMATPNATGSLLLVQEYYNQKYGRFMRSATLKALAVHTADEAGNTPGPDYIYGYGLLNVLKATSVITSSFNQRLDTIIENTLSSGTPYTLSVVASGNGPLKATIAWTDPKGFVDNANYLNTAPELIHDLDLKISTTGSNTYLPWILNPNNPSAGATRGDDNINNIEQVLVDSTIPGKTYIITISNKGTLSRGTQAFSLIVSGIGGTAYCTSAASTSAGARIDNVTFAGINKNNPSGCTTYTNNTGNGTTIGQIQANQTLPISIALSSCDASSATKFVKVFMDYNNNGVFTDAGELAATSSAITGNGTFSGNITTPLGLKVGNTVSMRVVTVETSDATTITSCGTYSRGETQDYLLKVAAPTNDVSVIQIVAPTDGSRFNSSKYLVAAIKNNGSATASNIAVTGIVKQGATTITSITATIPYSLAPGSITNYTFQKPFNLAAATTYTISITASTLSDQDATNNTLTQDITTTTKATISGKAEICGTSPAYLVANNPVAGRNYFWYNSSTAVSPIAKASATTTTTIPSDKIYNLSSGARVGIGPVNNNVYGAGSYGNNFVGFYTLDSASVPVILETAKIYATSQGKFGIGVHAATRSATGGISYYLDPVDSVTLDVYPNLNASNVDTGAYYNLNLHLDNSLSNIYIIYFNTYNGASVYRNNLVTNTTGTSPYPIGASNIFHIVNTFASPNPENYYYFLYDMKISTFDSLSDRVEVLATVAPTPVITQNGNLLTSSVTSGIQWYFAGNPITGANSATYTATQSGLYKVVTNTDAFGCSQSSNTINVVVTAVQNVSATEIGLITSPNPNYGAFNISFNMATKADVTVSLINVAGQTAISKTYPNFIGKFNEKFNNTNLSAGTYILKIQAGTKTYHDKLVIIK
jgi:hypothetical protein